ncbi:MAG: caspase family protein [Elusimicrobia bacterium]|nr:caspase family protein [Elusimicrobiota bacterium]
MRTRFLPLLLSFLLIPGLAAAGVWPDLSSPSVEQGGGGNDTAVVVGIERYPFVAPVPGAAQNADDWHLYLTKTRGIPASQVKLLRDSEATLEDIREAASWAASAVKPGGTLWFVFIGHGAPHKDGKEGVLIGVDAQQRAESLYNRSLRQSELKEILAKGPQAQSVVVLDACFSGRTAEGKELIKGLQPLIVVASPLQAWDRAAVFTAGKSDQFAGPLPGAQKPAFSYLLLGALRGWADSDKDGSVTAPEALAFTQDTLQALLKDRRQTPELFGSLASPLARPVHEQGPDMGAIARSVRPKDASELSFGEVAAVTLPTLKVAEIQGGFKEADINVERMLETAMLTQKDPEALPLEKMQYWCGLWGTPEGNPYRDQAAASCKEWRAFTDKYQEAELNLVDDYANLGKYLSLKLKTQEQKAAALNAFLTAYAALKDHAAFQEAAKARDLLASAGAASLPPMDDRGPLPRLKGQELPPELLEQAFSPCSGTWCNYQEECKAGKSSGCESYAQYGVGYTDDRSTRKTAFYMLACLYGSASSCGNLLGFNASTIAGTKSMGVAMSVWTHACFLLMNHNACNSLGEFYGQAKGLSSSDLSAVSGQAVLASEAACLRGIAESCLKAGNTYRNKSSRTFQELKRAKLLFAKGCRQNHGDSCGALASLKSELPNFEAELAKKIEVEKKLAQQKAELASQQAARKSVEEACEGSEPCRKKKASCARKAKDCVDYGLCFESGSCGTPKNPVLALELYDKACDAKSDAGCYKLSYCHRYGRGTVEDQPKANIFRDLACEFGSAEACNDIGSDTSYGGNGEPQNTARSLNMRKKACDMGKADSCDSAAGWIASGIGTPADKDEAITWARKGCKLEAAYQTCSRGMELGDSWSRKQVAKICDKDPAIAQRWTKECQAAR